MSEPDSVIHNLRDTLNNEPGLADRLERSLDQARRRAESELNPDLYEALEWPRDIGEYESYLRRFLRWVPHESDADAWKNEKRQAQEVSDRMAHFYFLVDQGDEPAQGSGVFREWLTDFARQWGNFLDTPESFSPEALQSFIDNAPEYRIHESLVDGAPNAPSGWLTANQFIAREINGGAAPDRRADHQPGGDLAGRLQIPARLRHRCRLEHPRHHRQERKVRQHQATHRRKPIQRELRPRHLRPLHAARARLPPLSPARRGTGRGVLPDQRGVFMRVGLEEHEFASSDSASSGYEFSQTRGVVTVDTSQSDCGDIGIVAVIPVGMAHVSSVVLTAVPGKHMAKGEEFGYFQFGGSDIIILFQEGVDPQLDTSEEFRLVGSPVARCAAPRNPQ